MCHEPSPYAGKIEDQTLLEPDKPPVHNAAAGTERLQCENAAQSVGNTIVLGQESPQSAVKHGCLNSNVARGMQTREEQRPDHGCACSKVWAAPPLHCHYSDEVAIAMSIDVRSDRQSLETSKIAVEVKRESGAWVVLVRDGQHKVRELPDPSSTLV